MTRAIRQALRDHRREIGPLGDEALFGLRCAFAIVAASCLLALAQVAA